MNELNTKTSDVVIRATGLHKRFTEGSGDAALDVHVLQGVSLTVKRGETIAIVGASGSGKSTLLHLMGGLEAPSEGRVELMGRDIAGMGASAQGNWRNAHLGATVQHRSRVAIDPMQPNLRRVHLILAELLDELRAGGFEIGPGEIGENITTRGIALLEMPRGARLYLGASAVVELTGLRNPCAQFGRFRPDLMNATLARKANGALVRKAGVMGIVLSSGEVRAGDAMRVGLPAGVQVALERV